MSASTLHLAVDVGASRTAAAIARTDSRGETVSTPFALGRHTDSVPSALFVGEGELLFGDAAVRRGITQPERLIRDFKRRVGDGTPLLAGGRRFSPEQVFALLVEWVIGCVVEREGVRPAALTVSIPATWTSHRSGLVSRALERVGWPDVRFISEPESAAHHYASDRALGDGLVGVYDLGGGTFDTALVRVDGDTGLMIVGEPAGLEAFGGSDFDDAVLHHVVRAAGVDLADFPDDDDARLALTALRREVVEAKEALSFDSETTVLVLLGDARTTVRLTRSEFEGMIEDGIHRTIDVLASLIDAVDAPQHADGITILLTGGSSRIPRIAQLISERFDCPVAVDADPKSVISLGAARALAEEAGGATTGDETSDPPPLVVHSRLDGAPAFARPQPRRAWLSRAGTIAAVAVGAIVLSVGIAVAALLPGREAPETGGQDDSTSSSRPSTPPSPEATQDAPPPDSADPLLTPAPAGVVTDIFPPPGDEELAARMTGR